MDANSVDSTDQIMQYVPTVSLDKLDVKFRRCQLQESMFKSASAISGNSVSMFNDIAQEPLEKAQSYYQRSIMNVQRVLEVRYM